jgi:LmbE family N-acetylglucosaminyl deacetylase
VVTETLRLMCVLAHPDDESLGMGGTLVRYSAEGIETHLVTATRGERGRFGSGTEFPGFGAVGAMREKELLAAAQELGVREVRFLDYMDGDLDQARPKEVLEKIVAELRRVRPQVVITFGPEGAYGHPDHIAICQFTTAATLCAADPGYRGAARQTSSSPAHRISKLYYMAWTRDKWAAYQAAFRDLKTTVDGVERRVTPWPDWAVTSVIDTHAYWPIVWRAVSCHKTQLEIYSRLEHLPEEQHRAIWGTQEYYRVFSLVNGGRKRETDLFEGLR